MNFRNSIRMMLSLAIASPAFATVVIHSPANATTVGSSVTFSATATTSTCSKGVSAMGVYVDNSLKYQTPGTSLNTTLTLAPGTHQAVLEEWDACGGATTASETFTVNGGAGVHVTSPVSGATVVSPALFAATSTTACASGVAAMGVYVGGALVAKSGGATLSAQVQLGQGTQTAVVQEWDNCGGSAQTPVTVTVGPSAGGGGGTTGKTIYNAQAIGGWNQWGEEPPVYDICSPCKGIWWTMQQHESAVSLDGNATKYTIGGTTPYADVLWSNKLIGTGTTLGMPDSNHTLLPSIRHMTFDAEILPTNMAATQDIELDMNIYLNGLGFEWGTECNHLNGGVWDIWNAYTRHWAHTSVPCTIVQGTWNHVNFNVARLSNNDLLYQNITVNGKTWNLNIAVGAYRAPSNWYGMTLNVQLDGNSHMQQNTIYVDKMSVAYY